ncbi:hypothetical protein AMTRI_Chr10g224780 [Amborella trichopoda]|uniref:alpha-amylase n=1 Tax=Amborella trichopoda TaxID=13333 RepID=W1NWG9_AMBTC|nr:uncharacterized protein LOC18428021 isoform X2 [Amborella trichopoda]XP_020519124.1 uncharacterized protein LOC18428021 isoform X2 [Amborella trichopoda]XP_020519125.1 uncharacterized protein LOC18428021 isoform X2 [Amborella trichopoda]ERM99977.1 hypothetical protein AMTR_s00110p00125590 [Amborella trichopoda]|eukprot:XP_006837124.1 uncharacterized protein LOC18428021 isoform X2 [Amborella trichopoda]
MALLAWPGVPSRSFSHHSILPRNTKLHNPNLCIWHHSFAFRNASNHRRKIHEREKGLDGYQPLLRASMGDSKDILTDTVFEGDGVSSGSGNGEVLQITREEFIATNDALEEARLRQEAAEKERDRLTQDLALSEAKLQEYAATIDGNRELAVAELEAAKSLFHDKLQDSLNEKFALETRLVLAKQDAVELAVQVEKLAEIAFQQSTSHILEDAQMRVSAAGTSAAEAAYHIEEQLRTTTENTLSSIVEQSNDTLGKVLMAAQQASDHAKRAMESLTDGLQVVDEMVSVHSMNVGLQSAMSELERQLTFKQNEVDRLSSELELVQARANSLEARANSLENTLAEVQESTKRKLLEQEEATKSLLKKFKEEAAKSEASATMALKVELEGIRSTVDAAKKTMELKDRAYMQRCLALERSLKASEAATNVWRQRAEMAESLLQEGRLVGEEDQDATVVVNGGRLDILTEDDSQRWRLLADGPRRDIPEWMARRIRSICPKFPPRKTTIPEELTVSSSSLTLPKPEEVWSIAQEKPKQGDTFIKQVIEKEAIGKQRKALERALQRKTIQRQRIPEPTKLEPGTGTGHEIVFQGFNWESSRRRWYLELAPKAADLSHCGITAVWLPPPTESVAPQGYMPSDLYNLNSAYGTVDELKQCIEEFHSQDLLALGDVVLNHRCAQKQSPNGVWNIFGGKLAWGPEAIVCDDPNFQGLGNPSSGDIFHAAPNVDHSQEFVRRDIKEWLNWLRSEIGFDGWRLDFVRGFSGGYVKEYIEASNPAFAIGEYWDSLAYEGGNLCYNQDAHRQRIVNWINATSGTSSAFDVTSKGILHSALHNQYWRLIDPQGKPTGVMGWWPSRAVTFLENHDTGSTQGHWPFPREKLTQGYAYILTHPGTPVIFYDHFYDFGLRDVITELIEARSRAGIHCRSSVKIYHANNEGYVAQIGDTLLMKIGHLDWNPSKENQLEGSWQKFVDKGGDYQLWLRP